jgi:hypothetical protein
MKVIELYRWSGQNGDAKVDIFIFPTPAHLNFYFNITIMPTSSQRFNGNCV